MSIGHYHSMDGDKDNDKESPKVSTSSPYPENPYTADRDTGNPYPENSPQSSTNISNTDISNNHRVCTSDTLTDSEYDDLVLEFGKENVDYQINRIKDRGYKGCYNFNTIKAWCKERLNRTVSTPPTQPKKNPFLNFKQRDYDFDELERLLLCN